MDEVGVLPIMAYTGREAPPEKGKGFYSLEYMTARVWNSVIWVPKGYQMNSMAS